MPKMTIKATLFIATSCFALAAQANMFNQPVTQQFSDYHPAGFAAQLSAESLGLAYYTHDHQYTFGGGISPYSHIKTEDSTGTTTSDVKTITYSVFARRNFMLTNQLSTGVGLDLSKQFSSSNSPSTEIDSNYGVTPYVYLEYALTNHLYLGTGVNVYNYNYTKFKDSSTSTTNQFFDGVKLQLSYLF